MKNNGLITILVAMLLFAAPHLSSAQVALHFAGDDDWVTGTNSSLPQGNNPRTIEAWIRYNTGNDKSIFNYGTFSNNQKFTLHLYNGVYIIGEGNDLSTGFAVNDGNWHHVAVTHDGTTTVVYVDGIVRGTKNTTYNTTGTYFQLGISDRNGSMDFRYQGTMDNVRVWNIARTQQQLQDNMYASITSATNLVASFDFEEGIPNGDNTAITTVIDGTGIANGTLNNFTRTGTTSNYVSGTLAYSYDPSCPSTTVWNGATWSDGVPDAQTNVILNGDLNINTPTEVCGMIVADGVLLSVAPENSLTVHGDLINAGTVRAEADAIGIGSLITNASISGSGSFQMQRYMTGSGGNVPNGRFWYASSPVADATSNICNAALIDNKLWRADEPSQSYMEITDNTSDLNVAQGYVFRLGATETIVFSGGYFNTGDISAIGLTRTGTLGSNRGYNLVGNPYPSSVIWDDLARTNLESSIWFRRNGFFDTYNAAGMVGTNNSGWGEVDGTIPATQAFWVRVDADGNTGQLDFENTDRNHGTIPTGVYKLEAEEGTVRLALSDGSVSDETIVYFNMDALDSFDDFDSHKMWMDNIPQLYTTTGEDSLTINGLFSIETNPIVDLGIKAPTTGNYTITASSITLTEEVWLEDRLLNIFQHLNQNPVYAFTTDAGNIGDRFALHFGMMAVGIGRDAINGVSTHVFAADGVVNVSVGEDAGKGMITILDMAGRTVQTAAINGSRTIVATDLVTGIYLVRVETEKGGETHRVMLR
jgi:hypothetical protein